MRVAIVSLIAVTAIAPLAQAQTQTAVPAVTPAAAPAAAPAMTPMAPVPAVPAVPATPASPTAPAAAPDAVAVPVTPAAPVPEAPPAPPPAPTDPTAIALISTLEKVCIPAANGGNLEKIAKANGFRKSGDNFVMKAPGYQFTILAPGSNPTQCHVDMVHPVDPEGPAKPIVVALHNWAVMTRGWSLYRNDKNIDSGQEFTTRSWEHSAGGKNEAVVVTTIRKADGTPLGRAGDTSMMIYSVTKTPGG